MSQDSTKYSSLHEKFLREAEQLLKKKDYLPAGEKVWGVMAEMVKAVAAKRGIALGEHRSIARYVLDLEGEKPDWRILDTFSQAQTLHTNFYEDHLSEA